MPCQTTSVSSRPRIFGFWRERSIPPLACPGTPLYGGLWATLRASKMFFRLKTACRSRFAGVPGQLREPSLPPPTDQILRRTSSFRPDDLLRPIKAGPREPVDADV